MKLVSYKSGNSYRSGIYYNGGIYDFAESAKLLNKTLPERMDGILAWWDTTYPTALELQKSIESGKLTPSFQRDDVVLLAPVPNPPSCRDGYAFRQHVATARRNRGVEMIQEFDQFPIFYMTNHLTVFGEGDVYLEDDHFRSLDFELECAIVIGKGGKNISSANADEHIAGYMIMNDLSARVLQMEEMKLNLGPAKGKDFATTTGPFLVTKDELADALIKTEFGEKYNLSMKAYHNGEQISDGNLNQMDWTFAEIVERASYGVMLHPGDIIGSGTVGTGCYLELNGSRALDAKAKGESYTPVWLKENDVIELEIEKLGRLKNTMKNSGSGISILGKKKNI